MSDPTDAIQRLNPEPTAADLEAIAPGCFVRVRLPQGCAWVEVIEERAEILVGQVQGQLNGPDCKAAADGGELHFRRDQIIDLGCHHYCFC